MALQVLKQVKEAIGHLNPNEVRQEAERSITIGITASSTSVYTKLEQFLAPPVEKNSPLRLGQILFRRNTPGAPAHFDLELYEEGIPKPPYGVSFDSDRLDKLINKVLEQHPELSLPLARHVGVFRQPVIQRAIKAVAKENALFSLATAVPNIVPLLSLPLGVGEFASDAAFLTMNQIRLAFLIAAASGCPIGYKEQRGQIASIIASAFGWRAIARELVGFIPLGGGLIPKAGIAYAGTYAVGQSLERYFRLGKQFTDDEQKAAFQAALERGKQIASSILASLKSQQHRARA